MSGLGFYATAGDVHELVRVLLVDMGMTLVVKRVYLEKRVDVITTPAAFHWPIADAAVNFHGLFALTSAEDVAKIEMFGPHPRDEGGVWYSVRNDGLPFNFVQIDFDVPPWQTRGVTLYYGLAGALPGSRPLFERVAREIKRGGGRLVGRYDGGLWWYCREAYRKLKV